MAGEMDRDSSEQTGRVARRPVLGRLQPGHGKPERVGVPIEVGPEQAEIQPLAEAMLQPVSASPTRQQTADEFHIQIAYRQLVSSGISGEEAAGLISYVIGLAACESRWSIAQINKVLFLRDLYRNTDWGAGERKLNASAD